MAFEGGRSGDRLRVDDAPTRRQRQVLALVARGHTSGEIAERLGISRSTVETHIQEARVSLSARTRAQAAALVVRGPVHSSPVQRMGPLTCDERRILGLLAAGLALGEAAEIMHLSRRTADRRLAAARGKLGVRTTAEALVIAGEPERGS